MTFSESSRANCHTSWSCRRALTASATLRPLAMISSKAFSSSAVISRPSASAFSAISLALAQLWADLGDALLEALLTH